MRIRIKRGWDIPLAGKPKKTLAPHKRELRKEVAIRSPATRSQGVQMEDLGFYHIICALLANDEVASVDFLLPTFISLFKIEMAEIVKGDLARHAVQGGYSV